METHENTENETEPRARAGHGNDDDARGVLVPLRRLVELALEHPNIGPPLADLAFAIGQKEVGDQLVRLGTERENPRVEYFVIAGYAARRGRRFAEVFKLTLDALRALRDQTGSASAVEEGERVLQLVRNSLSVLMFDLKDLTKEPEFTRGLAELLPEIEDRLGGEVLYRTLLAQALWFTDKDASERQWERARELATDVHGIENVWNARGTWAKEADRDLEKAERAYRRGLEAAPESALLLHNLAQVLVERAEHAAPSPGAARHLLNQAQDLLRRTLRADVPRLRRHIHATRDRLEAVRRSLPPMESHAPPPASQGPNPGPGPAPNRPRDSRPAPATGAAYGASAGGAGGAGGSRGAGDARDARDARGAARPSRQADAPRQNNPPPRQERPEPVKDPGQAFLRTGTVTLGDLLKAKLEKAKDKGK